MLRGLIVVVIVVVGLGVFIWASDRITLEGERTIYTVACEQGMWDGLRCTGHLAPGDRHRFRASHSRNEVVYWIAGSPKASGKYTGCSVTDRDHWACKANAGDQPSIAHELADGKPVQHEAGPDLPFYAVHKWKWWAMRAGIDGFHKADFSNELDPHPPRTTSLDAGRH